MNSDPLITMVVGGIVAAFALGFLAHKLSISPIVGYLLAGILLGPYTPGFSFDADLARELAELGVILIMFGVGLKFSPRKLMDCRWVALPCALGQMAIVTALGFGLSWLLRIPPLEGLIFGFCLSVASTVVLLRTLEDQHLAQSPTGHVAMAWLIVQDLFAVFALVVMSVLAAQGTGPVKSGQILHGIAVKAAELTTFGIIMFVVGRRILPGLLVFIARAKSRELFSLGVFAIALGIAYLADAVFGATFAIGAFLAGLVLSEAELSHRAAEDMLPLRDAFAVLFFVSVGMLFDPHVLITQKWTILAVLAVIMAGNAGAAFLMTSLVRMPLAEKLLLAGGLAQIGEFSFLISGFGMNVDLMSEESHGLIAAGALLAIALNPLLRLAMRLLARHHAGAAVEDVPAALGKAAGE
ncbi:MULTISPECIES: cation:proton antiporter [Rhodomicrobium]|uniref:cation:proton antiporter domain-containing protein n=1 Tax=Rhodomicrobium TaxID=1068 RepID=UPI000B4AE64C|nr:MULTISPECIES: cation:proton antiporter [Rhodomicrobium]